MRIIKREKKSIKKRGKIENFMKRHKGKILLIKYSNKKITTRIFLRMI